MSSASRPRPAWASKPLVDRKIESSTDLFSRSSQTLARIREDETRRREKKARKEQRKAEKEAAKDVLRSAKRRRVSPDGESPRDLDGGVRDCAIAKTGFDARVEEEEEEEDPVAVHKKRGKPGLEDFAAPGSPKKASVVIDLDSDGENDSEQPKPPDKVSNICSSTPEPSSTTIGKDHENTAHAPQPQPQPPQPAGPDPALSILLHSRVPHTVPVILKVRLSQRLRVARHAWCHKQSSTHDYADLHAKCFLMFCGKRCFDVTNCKSLGVSVDEDSREVYIKGRDWDGTTPENTQLEMEVVTEEILAEDKKREEIEKQEKRRAMGGIASDGEEAQARGKGENEEEKESTETGTRIVLKAKGYEDFHLRVKPTTKFEQIEKAFKRKRKPPADRKVFLMFDGERLDENEMMGETEVADMDNIDVHIK